VNGTAKTVQALNRLDIEQPRLNVNATNTGTSVKVSYRSKQEDVAAYRVDRVQEGPGWVADPEQSRTG
jgi:hypothetical protein